jgi:CubicO group peptidase (beta-lactamase class C family)
MQIARPLNCPGAASLLRYDGGGSSHCNPMRRAASFLTLVALTVVGAPARAEDLLFDRFREYVESLRAQAGIPGLAAAIVGRKDILWEGAFGHQDVERAIVARTDTPFHLDASTQIFTAAIVLRCVEEGRLSLDDEIGRFRRDAPEPNATIRQLLTHTSGSANALVFSYRPERLAPLASAIRACAVDSYRETLADLLERLAMVDSVPGADILQLTPPAEGIPLAAAAAHYARVLARLATPYAVDRRGRALPSRYSAGPLTPATGLVASARDVAQFDLALRNGVLLRDDTLASAWTGASGRLGQPLPHGMGWFVQIYKGERVVWQFGMTENAASSLVVTLPARGISMILLANSDGLVKPFALAEGDVTLSPFARLFLGLFVR